MVFSGGSNQWAIGVKCTIIAKSLLMYTGRDLLILRRTPRNDADCHNERYN